jgi:uncharacterized membrane protein (UPF0182 family)
VVVGAGYTDLHFHLPVLTVLVGLALVGTALCIANLWVGGVRLPALAVILVLAGSLSASVGAALFQSYRVKPDELRLEAPYLARSIAGTRYGFALDRLTVKPFPAAGQLTPAVLAANAPTIQNLRWWDPAPSSTRIASSRSSGSTTTSMMWTSTATGWTAATSRFYWPRAS